MLRGILFRSRPPLLREEGDSVSSRHELGNARERWVIVISRRQASEGAKDQSRLVFRPSGADAVLHTEPSADVKSDSASFTLTRWATFFSRLRRCLGLTERRRSAATFELRSKLVGSRRHD